MKLSTGSEQEQRRDELLRVATQLVDVEILHQKSGHIINGRETYKYTSGDINHRALKSAKDLIAKVDAEFEDNKS